MRKILLTLAVVCSMMIVGCNNFEKCELPPWSEQQIEQFEQDEVKAVPVAVLRF